MKLTSVCAIVAALALSGCAIHQVVQPVAHFDQKDVCVVENPAVKYDFLPALKNAIGARGYTVRQLPANAALNACPITVTYTANWRWDLAMYMAYADITVYQDAKPSGKATYDATRGGSNMNKFIKADQKIAELVKQLFPG